MYLRFVNTASYRLLKTWQPPKPKAAKRDTGPDLRSKSGYFLKLIFRYNDRPHGALLASLATDLELWSVLVVSKNRRPHNPQLHPRYNLRPVAGSDCNQDAKRSSIRTKQIIISVKKEILESEYRRVQSSISTGFLFRAPTLVRIRLQWMVKFDR